MLLSSILLLSSTTFFISTTFGHSPDISNRTFTIDYNLGTFLKDGKPFRYISGTLHYFRVPHELWRDRMLRMRALGCNVLQTVVPWSRHQPNENLLFNLVGDANITQYLTLAQELGFLVILRPGPYVCSEQDFGGFPYWLLKKEGIILRSIKDARYLSAVQAWFKFLLSAIIRPLLYTNGGPIIMVQIENEFGYTYQPYCDHKYMLWLTDLVRKYLGNDTVLFTTDNYSPDIPVLACGTVPGVLPTIDFGVASQEQVGQWFSNLRKIVPKGPLVNSEFYPSWFDKWGATKHATMPISYVLNTMQYIWSFNVTSINIYPAHGGTNWGYLAGGQGPPFQTITTEYDYDAPISEGGDTTPKFLAMRELIQNLTGKKIADPIPESPKKYAYGNAHMEWMGSVLDLINTLTPQDRIFHWKYPLTMEEVDQAYGFIVYETTLPKSKGRLEITSVHDRAYVMVAGQLVKVIQRGSNKTDARRPIQLTRIQPPIPIEGPVKLHILVENQGRICFGSQMNDSKGLLGNVTLDDKILTNWTIYPIDLSKIYKLSRAEVQKLIKMNKRNALKREPAKHLPSIYYGYFFTDPVPPGDTFFDPTGWGKGQLFINGRNMGRYWPQAGPQITLYVPAVYLAQTEKFNQIYVFELDQPGNCGNKTSDGCSIQFVDKPKYTKI